MTERPAPPSGSVTVEELGARLDEMIDRVLAGEEIVVLRESTPVARLVPIEPRPRERLGTLKEFLSEDERRALDDAMSTPLSEDEQRIMEGEGTDELGIWRGLPQKRGDGTEP